MASSVWKTNPASAPASRAKRSHPQTLSQRTIQAAPIDALQRKALHSPATQKLSRLQNLAETSLATSQAATRASAAPRNHLSPTTLPVSIQNAPLQRKQYSVTRDMTLEQGIKTFETTPFQKGKKNKPDTPEKTAKSKAKGEFYAALRSEYPVPESARGLDFDQQEQARGSEYLLRKKMIDDEFDKVEDSAEKVDVYRPAITAETPDAKRSGGTQAKDVSKLTGKTYIGAHLVKREWGGEDNMWNVVAWPKDSAEDKWAAEFEAPIDKAGLWGLEPGSISIEVTKEDDLIPKMRLDQMIEGAVRKMQGSDEEKSAAIKRSLDPHFMDPVNTLRHFVNRAVESVPIKARGAARAPDIKTGETKQSVTTLDASETAYDKASIAAVDAIKSKIDTEIIKTTDIDAEVDAQRHHLARAPQSLRDTDSRETGKRHAEREKDWKSELKAYDKGFDTQNDLI